MMVFRHILSVQMALIHTLGPLILLALMLTVGLQAQPLVPLVQLQQEHPVQPIHPTLQVTGSSSQEYRMPLDLEGPLTQELLMRQTQKPPQQEERESLSPTVMALLGSAADGASTYKFMKEGRLSEDNAMLAGHGPLVTGLSAAGTGLAGIGLSKLIGMKYPKIGNALLANLAGQQLGVGLQNFAGPRTESAFQTVNKGLASGIKSDPTRFLK